MRNKITSTTENGVTTYTMSKPVTIYEDVVLSSAQLADRKSFLKNKIKELENTIEVYNEELTTLTSI